MQLVHVFQFPRKLLGGYRTGVEDVQANSCVPVDFVTRVPGSSRFEVRSASFLEGVVEVLVDVVQVQRPHVDSTEDESTVFALEVV